MATVGEIIEFLEQEDQDAVLKLGFHYPHSYRGYYSELGLEPIENITIKEMVGALKSAIGTTYTGYKGGEYTMSEYSDCYLANYGSCGAEISLLLLGYMVKDTV